jgi:urease accessory protein
MSLAIASDRIGRDGTLSLAFSRVGDRTVLARSRYTLPLQVLAPLALDDRATVVSILNPTGGLLGGDRLTIDVRAGAGAHACLTTPSATKVYRTSAEPACQDVRLQLERGAAVEWVPDHTIPFVGSKFRQRIDVELAEAATLVLVDTFAAGRVTRGEAWRFGLLDSAVSIRDERGRLLHDRFVLAPGDGVSWDGAGFTEGRPYFGTVVVIADAGAGHFIDAVAEIAAHGEAELAAAPLPRRGAIVRLLARTAPALTSSIDRIWSAARCHVLGAPPLSLRKP